MNKPKIIYCVHAVKRMFERDISAARVSNVLQSGEMIEDYSPEMPDPSRLLLGFQGKRPLHVVTSENQKANEITIITVYIPSLEKWNKDFKSRRA